MVEAMTVCMEGVYLTPEENVIIVAVSMKVLPESPTLPIVL